jgi:hypothetical protein
LGALTKAQFIFFGPLLLAAIWRNGSRPPLGKAFVLVALFSAGAISLKALASQGTYTTSYGGEAILENLRASKTIYLFIFAAFIHLVFVIWRRKKEDLPQASAYSIFSPAFGLLAFVALMLPWRVGGYLNVIAMPFLSLILGSWALAGMRLGKARWAVMTLTLLAPAMVTLSMNQRQYQALGSLRALVNFALQNKWPEEVRVAMNTCNEGSGHIQHYLNKFGGLNKVEVKYADPITPISQHATQYWIEHPRICPPPPLEGAREFILGETHDNAFQLVKYKNQL